MAAFFRTATDTTVTQAKLTDHVWRKATDTTVTSDASAGAINKRIAFDFTLLSDVGSPGPEPVVSSTKWMSVIERPPIRLTARITGSAIDERDARWAYDEDDPANVPIGLTFSDTAPGGCEQLSAELVRIVSRSYNDLDDLEMITIYGPGGEMAWQGRLDQAPRQDGEDTISINPTAVGYQSHLDDLNSVRMIPIDQDLSQWQGASVQRKINLVSGVNPDGSSDLLGPIDLEDPTVVADSSTGQPSLETGMQGSWQRNHAAEAWYDANGIILDRIMWRWRLHGIYTPLSAIDPNWSIIPFLSDDDVASSVDQGMNQNDPTIIYPGWPTYGDGTLVATTNTRKWARLDLFYLGAGGVNGQNYALDWSHLAVFGRHPGIAIRNEWPNVGVLASDVIAYGLSVWCPKLSFSLSTGSTYDDFYTIQQSSYLIPHLPFKDPTTMSDVVKQASRFELLDWFVWPGSSPTFYMSDRGAAARFWRAPAGPSRLANVGPQSTDLWNGVIVSYTDVTGIQRSVGPPGSGSNTESSTLLDPDTENPVTQAGYLRYATLSMGTSVADAAIQVGMRFLEEQKLITLAGTATLPAFVEDQGGRLWPSWMVRSGDYISFPDASDPSNRRIVRKEWDENAKTASISLDSPPNAMQQLLERLSAAIMPFGLS